jgi:RNA polymerase sigma factor (TIGR02999 family)
MDRDSLNDLVQALYRDLHRIAERQLRAERSDHTLQATALLHEAYVKLSENEQRQFSNRPHFLAVASRVMRQVLVDYARGRATEKRSADKRHALHENESLTGLQLAGTDNADPVDILALSRAIEALAEEDAELAELVALRYFGGMTAEETAEALGRSVHGVRHDLRLALAWLRRTLNKS